MILNIISKLPMRDKAITKKFYCEQLGYKDISANNFESYLILEKNGAELHFFEHKALDILQNYGQVYIRMINIDKFYQNYLDSKIRIHPNGKLETKSWGQREFSILDPDHNLLTFGQSI